MTDAKDRETVDARLRRLAAATSEITPPPGLAERLAAGYRAGSTMRASPPSPRLGRSHPRGIAGVVLPFYRPVLFAAALAAAASIALAIQVGLTMDESAALTDDGGWWDL